MAELEALLDGADGALSPQQLASAHRLATEARFGIEQRRREQHDNGFAVAAHARCVHALIELELRQGHADTARALADELDEPPAELRERIERAEADVARQRAAEERMRAMARDLDPTVAARARTLVLIGATVVLVDNVDI